MDIYEHQQGGDGPRTSGYTYVGPTDTGFHEFKNGKGESEFFARRATPYAGWHLQRGKWFYEFCTSRSPN